MLNLNLNILGASNKPIVPIQPAPIPTTTTTTSTTTTSTTTSGGKYIPPVGLVQYLDATLASSYPGSGSVWFDLSGNSFNATASFGATFPTYDAVNTEFGFNGTNNSVAAGITTITTFSAFTWVKLNSLTPGASSDAEGAYGLSTKGNSEVFDSLTFTETVQSKWEIATENNNRDVLSPVAETSLDYLFMGITSTDGSVKLWRNGVVLASAVKTPVTYANGNVISLVGQRYYLSTTGWPTNGWFNGDVSMCLLYDRVLTDQEITDLYTQGR
jgi:hypothetical protein